jgi:AmmeMemoRadiSam system protein A
MALHEEQKKALLALARSSIKAHLERASAAPCDEPVPKDAIFHEFRAVFVTLHIAGRLRGCIGNLEASETLWQNVWRMADRAAFSDPRFRPLSVSEYENIDLEISVLTPFQKTTIEEIIVGEHGVLIEQSGRSAVFLPQVAPEQGWDRQTLLTELCLKAGLSPFAWQSGEGLSSFSAEVFGELKK